MILDIAIQLEHKQWLRDNSAPWDLVVERWEKSFQLRREDKTDNLSEYINNWPILKNSKAYLLVNLIEFEFF